MHDWLDQIENIKLRLKRFKHNDPSCGFCAMELVAFMERLPHSNAPPCTCLVIAAYVRQINDRLDDADRQRLLPYLPLLVGTVSKEHQVARAEYIVRHTAQRLTAPMFEKRWPEHAKDLASAHTMVEIKEAARAARSATAAYAKYGTYAAYDSAYAAAYAAAADAASTDTDTENAYAVHDAAVASAYAAAGVVAAGYDDAIAAKNRFADVALEILDGVLQIGPQGKGFTSTGRLEELAAIAL